MSVGSTHLGSLTVLIRVATGTLSAGTDPAMRKGKQNINRRSNGLKKLPGGRWETWPKPID